MQTNSDPMIETGVSFAVHDRRWASHKIGLSFDQVAGSLEAPALEKWLELSLIQRVFLVRAVAEIALCKFRETRKDPDYAPTEITAWRTVVHGLVGSEGLERLGL